MEKAKGQANINLTSKIPLHEFARWIPHWTINKYNGDFPEMSDKKIQALGNKPYETLEFDGNCLLNGGINSMIWPAIVGALASSNYLNGTYGCIGVGDSSTAASASQTGLQAATNRIWVLISATPTTGSNQQIIISATFASAQANFAWNEICAGSTSTPGSLPVTTATPPATAIVLNRLVQSMGTKASGTSWTATLTITLS